MVKCFYHSADLDGHASGAIVKQYMEDNDFPYEMHPIDYGDKFPWDTISLGDEVYFVDFTLQPAEDMVKLSQKCQLIVIDHHKSAMKDMEALKFNPEGIREVGRAGCQLAWEYFYDTPEPLAIKLLGEYDCWLHTDERTLPFQYYMRSLDTDPKEGNLDWSQVFLMKEGVMLNDFLSTGRSIIRYQKKMDQALMKGLSYLIEWEGRTCLVCNAFGNSNTFESRWDPDKHDLMVMYKHVKGQYFTVSLYCPSGKVDCSVIAKTYGGGGHAGAAGFQTEMLPWSEPYKI